MSKSRSLAAGDRPRQKKRYYVIAITALIVVFGGLAVFNYVLKPIFIAQFISKMLTQPPLPVSVAAAMEESWQGELPAIGTIEAQRGVTLAPQIAGRVESILFQSGQWVAAGQAVVKLDDSTERAQLQAALADQRLKELNLVRARELAQRGNMAQANLDQAVAQRDQAAAQVELIRAQITQKTIVAPFAGRLGIRQINLGQYLAAGAAIVTLQSIDPIFVNFTLPEREIPRLKVGQKVVATIEGLPGKTFDGTITSLDAKVDEATRNILVQATFANKNGDLVPGMFTRLKVELAEVRKLVIVPETAVSFSLYGDSVYVVGEKKDKDGKVVNGTDGKPLLAAERRFVRVAERRDGKAGIYEGVKPGERVVTSGQTKLQPNATVVIDSRPTLVPPKERPKP
ncbi:MAG: efflux RND transporter periplasmic adaptor subunit [Rhodospirillaceae bacterium]|nr:efflux RND transporter periplasmic adaptor subunit [Rhodospirillaceae bacterium]